MMLLSVLLLNELLLSDQNSRCLAIIIVPVVAAVDITGTRYRYDAGVVVAVLIAAVVADTIDTGKLSNYCDSCCCCCYDSERCRLYRYDSILFLLLLLRTLLGRNI